MTTRSPRILSQQQQDIQHLCQKVQEGDEAGVRQLLHRNPILVNLQDDGLGVRPLHVAARCNQPTILGLLIEKGAEVNARSRDQESTALHIAARLKDRKRLAAEEQAAASHQEEEQDGFLSFAKCVDPDQTAGKKGRQQSRRQLSLVQLFKTNDLQQENDVPPALSPAPAVMEQTTTELLMNCPDIDPNAKDRLGETPLHYAARWGNTAECRLILDTGRNLSDRIQVDINVKDKDGLTPLHHTCFHMCTRDSVTKSRHRGDAKHYHEIASLLIKNNANIMAEDNNGNTPLHLAADEGCLAITEALLEAATSSRITQEVLAARNIKDDTALNIAVKRDYYEVTRHILSRGTNEIGDANKDGDTPLHNCKHIGIFGTLLENLPDVNARNKDGATPLQVAARDGRLQILVEFEKLTQDQMQGQDKLEFFNCTDNDDRTPLLIASQFGHNAIVNRLLKNEAVNKGAKDSDGKTALYLAAENNHMKVLEAMFDGEGPMLNYLEETGTSHLLTPLHIAARNGHLDVVKILIQNGAQVRAKHYGGKTPLHLACQHGQFNIVRELVSYESAAVHDTNDRKLTPLHSAAIWGNFLTVQFLIDNDANLNAVNDMGETPLFAAANYGWDKTSRILIDSGADVTIQDKAYQRTALQIACMEGHVKVAEILLNYWSSRMDKLKQQLSQEEKATDWNGFLSHRDYNGKNCLDLAIENSHEEVAEMIIDTEGAWQFVLENCDPVDPNRPGDVYTPMRKLIKHMPNVAEMVFNKCIAPAGNGKVRFDYTYLDDGNERRNWMEISEQNKLAATEDEQRTYKTYKKTHVLTVLARAEKMELLSHPLVSALLRKKTRSCSMYIFYLQLFFYVVFLAFLTAFMVSSTPPYQFTSENGHTLIGNGSVCEQLEAGGYKQPGYSTVLQYITLTFAAVLLISEVIQLYQKKKGYFEFDNLVEWIIFVFAIIVTIDFSTCSDATSYRYPSQWSIGTAALFFGWINLALYLQKFPTIGIYIMMFKDILSTFLEFSIVYVLFLIAFALAFYSEIRTTAAYNTVGLAFVKTAVMMIGEFDYGDDFVGGDLHNIASTYILFVSFMIIMTILVMNLLVGLAVDDIKEIQNKAKLKRLQMQIDLVLDLESVVQVGLCCKTDAAMTEEIYLEKPRKLPFNLNNYVGKESFGLTLEAIEMAKNPEKTELDKIHEEQQNLRAQNQKLKESLKEQSDRLRSVDETLKLLLERLPEPQR